MNIGTVEGGTTPNTVPDYVKTQIDCRFTCLEESQRLNQLIYALNDTVTEERVKIKVTGVLLVHLGDVLKPVFNSAPPSIKSKKNSAYKLNGNLLPVVLMGISLQHSVSLSLMVWDQAVENGTVLMNT